MQTFDGERCLYAALNDDVRHTLLDEGFKRAGMLLSGAVLSAGTHALLLKTLYICSIYFALSLAGARGHDLFLDFVGKAFNVPEAYPDLIVDFEDETMYAHKFLLAVRAPHIGAAHTLSSNISSSYCTQMCSRKSAHVMLLLLIATDFKS